VGNIQNGSNDTVGKKSRRPAKDVNVDRQSITLEQEEADRQVYQVIPEPCRSSFRAFHKRSTGRRTTVPAIVHLALTARKRACLADVLSATTNPEGRLGANHGRLHSNSCHP